MPSDIGGSGSVRTRKERRDNENPEVKHELKINCAEALWMLARGNIASPMDAGFTLLNERTLDVIYFGFFKTKIYIYKNKKWVL